MVCPMPLRCVSFVRSASWPRSLGHTRTKLQESGVAQRAGLYACLCLSHVHILCVLDPRYIGSDRGETYLHANLDLSVLQFSPNASDTPDQKTIARYLSAQPTVSTAIGFIPEVCSFVVCVFVVVILC